ncbi:YggS family pyridoxal phosphate-dependent enzyme [Chryseolinea lacunae]|uniref:Pyridoxal phosphate homeostasis protein n=1 Tax=Chryseolinea lacunae TaxID=2801331 RepID=A0ABS1KUF0_9BACT|nr:YggS family pyridoxal phosphate-dependent enzyme [Chryseolinea lacunae]MBL0742928.1 YggS family pyridoxal phosphate-dependent enzyme [Chryseolinea lacunae]
MNIKNNINNFRQNLPAGCELVAVSKTKPIEAIKEAYAAGQRVFGENKVQELVPKHEALPKDIAWHMIGHLQSNKVKYIAPFVSLIHSVDSAKLLEEINKQAAKVNRIIPCLLQLHIAEEETKFGFSEDDVQKLFQSPEFQNLQHIEVRGLMGMATLTTDEAQIRKEFHGLRMFFNTLKSLPLPPQVTMEELSMGMSSDYKIAAEEGSTLIRVGSAIFGERTYQH